MDSIDFLVGSSNVDKRLYRACSARDMMKGEGSALVLRFCGVLRLR